LGGEALEQTLLGEGHAGELFLGQPWEFVRKEAGPDGVGVSGGAEGPRDAGRVAGVLRATEGDHRLKQLLWKAVDLHGILLRFSISLDPQV
jgi:hypothetical protein